MKQIKFMTKDQVKRIVSNNYCSEHDKHGNQFDYEAKGYRDEIDARLWELSDKKVNDMIKQARIDIKGIISAPICEKPLIKPNNEIKSELDRLDITISVNKAFFKWRDISNELMIKIV